MRKIDTEAHFYTKEYQDLGLPLCQERNAPRKALEVQSNLTRILPPLHWSGEQHS